MLKLGDKISLCEGIDGDFAFLQDGLHNNVRHHKAIVRRHQNGPSEELKTGSARATTIMTVVCPSPTRPCMCTSNTCMFVN